MGHYDLVTTFYRGDIDHPIEELKFNEKKIYVLYQGHEQFKILKKVMYHGRTLGYAWVGFDGRYGDIKINPEEQFKFQLGEYIIEFHNTLKLNQWKEFNFGDNANNGDGDTGNETANGTGDIKREDQKDDTGSEASPPQKTESHSDEASTKIDGIEMARNV